jgi:hypothetical protein
VLDHLGGDLIEPAPGEVRQQVALQAPAVASLRGRRDQRRGGEPPLLGEGAEVDAPSVARLGVARRWLLPDAAVDLDEDAL